MEADLRLLILRQKFLSNTTIGNMFLLCGGFIATHFGYTLEDTVRPPNIKIHGETAIQEGVYEVDIRWSPHMRRNVMWLRNVQNFSFIYIHTLNKSSETLGCIGVAKHYDGEKNIYDSLEGELFSIVEKYLNNGKRVVVDIRNIGNV